MLRTQTHTGRRPCEDHHQEGHLPRVEEGHLPSQEESHLPSQEEKPQKESILPIPVLRLLSSRTVGK